MTRNYFRYYLGEEETKMMIQVKKNIKKNVHKSIIRINNNEI